MNRTVKGFTSKQVISVTGVTRRQLTYWRKTGLVVPTQQTPGGHARYSFTDLIALKTAKQLVDAGISVQRIRTSIASLLRFLPSLQQPLTELSIVATGDVILAFHRGSVFEALTGQEWIVPVVELEQQLRQLSHKPPASRPLQGELFPELFRSRARVKPTPKSLLEASNDARFS
jgi:DNA-binding transcriptional MerR regulator